MGQGDRTEGKRTKTSQRHLIGATLKYRSSASWQHLYLYRKKGTKETKRRESDKPAYLIISQVEEFGYHMCSPPLPPLKFSFFSLRHFVNAFCFSPTPIFSFPLPFSFFSTPAKFPHFLAIFPVTLFLNFIWATPPLSDVTLHQHHSCANRLAVWMLHCCLLCFWMRLKVLTWCNRSNLSFLGFLTCTVAYAYTHSISLFPLSLILLSMQGSHTPFSLFWHISSWLSQFNHMPAGIKMQTSPFLQKWPGKCFSLQVTLFIWEKNPLLSSNTKV